MFGGGPAATMRVPSPLTRSYPPPVRREQHRSRAEVMPPVPAPVLLRARLGASRARDPFPTQFEGSAFGSDRWAQDRAAEVRDERLSGPWLTARKPPPLAMRPVGPRVLLSSARCDASTQMKRAWLESVQTCCGTAGLSIVRHGKRPAYSYT